MITRFSVNWYFLGLMALAFTSMAAIPLRADSLKSYTASITPSSFAQDDSHFAGPFTLTITNVDSNPGANQIGSARIVVPEGFSAPSLGTLAVSSGKCWSASLNSGVIDLEAINCPGGGRGSGEGQQKLALNESVSIQVSAVYCPGVYTWTTDASSEPSLTTWAFGSGDWTVSGEDPTLTVTNHCSGGADMPVTKTINGESPNCTDGADPRPFSEGPPIVGPGTGNPASMRPCDYPVAGVHLFNDDPEFEINLYPTDTDTGLPIGFPAQTPGPAVPPQFDTQVPWEFNFWFCETASTPYNLSSVTITAKDNADQVIATENPYIYFRSGYVGSELRSFACFHSAGPPNGTKTFAENLDNTAVCSYTQGGWGARPRGNNPGQLLASNFSSIGSVTIGDGSNTRTFSSAAEIEAYLPAGGTPGVIPNEGVFGGQVLALTLNVEHIDTVTGFASGIGDYLVNYPACYGNLDLASLPTVSDVLEDANVALGGGAVACVDGNISTLNDLVTLLNESFDNCTVNPQASILIVPPPPED